ncbi:O-antigen ligase family protein [Candidatus Sumerlaeota bacterium]|nr:O-antigen ligase family protein [Candidatus Sumerlaeota bacterium]
MKKSNRKKENKSRKQGELLSLKIASHVFLNMGLPFSVFLCVLVFYPLTRNANLIKELLWYALLPLCAGGFLFFADKYLRVFTLRSLAGMYRRLKPLMFFLPVFFLWNLFQRQRSVDSFFSAITLMRLASYLFTFFVLVLFLQKIKARFFFMEFLAFSSALCSSYMIAEYFGWDFLKWKTMDRPPGTFANPNFSADFLSAVLPLVLFWEVMGKNAIRSPFATKTSFVRKLFFPFRHFPARSLLMLIAILMSQSRSGFVTLATGGIAAAGALFLNRDKAFRGKRNLNSPNVSHHHRWFALLGLSLILIVEIFTGIVFWIAPEKLSHVFNATTVQLRLNLWEGCLILIRERPWFGWGLGSFGTVSQKINYIVEPIVGQKQAFHAHNWFLELLVEQGIIGAAFFLAFLAYMIRIFWKALRAHSSICERLILVGIISGALGLLSGMIFDVWLNWWEGGWILWLLLGFGSAVSLRILSRKDAFATPAKTQTKRLGWIIKSTGAILLLLSVLLFMTNYMIFQSERHVWRFHNLIQMSQYEKAMDMHARANIRIFPSPNMRFWNAIALYHAKKTNDAESILNQLMEKYPVVSKYPMMMGYIYIQRKKMEEAEASMKKACTLEPNGENAIKLCKFYISRKKNDDASRIMQDQLKKALYPPLLHLYLKLEKDEGRAKEARAFLSQLRENLPFLKRKSKGELARWEAELSTIMKDMGWAKKAYRLSLLYDPDNYQVWNDYGLVLKNLGYYDRSEKAFVRSIALKSDNFIPIFNRLELAIDRKDFELAKTLSETLKTMKLPPEAEKRLQDIGKILQK